MTYSGRKIVSQKGHSQRSRRASIVCSTTLQNGTTSVLSPLEVLVGINPSPAGIARRTARGIPVALRPLLPRIRKRDVARAKFTCWTLNPLLRAFPYTATPSGTSTQRPGSLGSKPAKKKRIPSTIHCEFFPCEGQCTYMNVARGTD